MIIVDEHVLVRSLSAASDLEDLPGSRWGIPYLHYVRLTVALHAKNVEGSLTGQLQELSDDAVNVLVGRDPRFFSVLDPRELCRLPLV